MSVNIATFEYLKQYVAGVLGRIKDHGPNINEVIYALIGFVIIHTDEIRVRGYDGDMGNVLWCRYEGKRFVFTYTHDDGGAIILRRRNLQGPEVTRFTNESTVDDIRKAFESKQLIKIILPHQTQAHEVHG